MATNATHNIYKELNDGHLLEALTMLKTKTDGLGNWQLQEDLEAAHSTYATMLGYIAQGIDDPESRKIRQSIIQQAYTINDKANIEIRLRKSPNDKYCQTLTSCRTEMFSINEATVALETLNESLLKLQTAERKRENIEQYETERIISQHDSIMEKLFNHVWTSTVWTSSNYSQYTDFMANSQISPADKALTVSAVTLAINELFDENKLMLLMDAYLDADTDISQRALVGLMLMIIRYDKRLKYYPQIVARFNLYTENKQFVADCFQTLIQLQYSKLTDTVSAKMANDIMPAILKSQRFKKSSVIELDAELTKNGENPEWHHQDNTDDEQAEKKIRQMSEMQMEGADVYLSSFRHLKSFGFFNQLHHWFSLFSYHYPGIYAIKNKMNSEVMSVVNTLLQTAPFCDSDKFSFICMLESIPLQGQEVIASQIKGQIEEANLEDIIGENKQMKRSAKGTLRSYIADIYRVFKVYPYHNQLVDPFNKQLKNFSPIYYDTLAPLLYNEDETMNLAEFMMRKGMYGDAFLLFMSLFPMLTEADADVWQKIGFCLQKQNDHEEALRIYLRAHKLQPQSMWTIQHIVQTAFECKDYETACEFIDMLLEKDSDNLKWLSRKAECLFGLEHYEECLPTLYKLTYLDESSERYKEMLAWGLLMTEAKEKAAKIYSELKDKHPSVKNTINLGHIYMINNDIPSASALYRQAYAAANDEETFRKHFWSQADYFDKMGLDTEQMNLIYDVART